MEEEIDLRQYIVVLIKYWHWIVGLAIVAALIAFVAGSFIPPTYEATALITTTRSRYEFQFDSRLRNVPDSAIQSLLQSQYRSYPILATRDDLLQQVADKMGWSLVHLKDVAEASQESNTLNLLILTVKGQNAAEVAELVNTWAELFVATTNTLYGRSGELERFRQQQEITAQSLSQADAALTAFREETGFVFNNSSSGDVNITMSKLGSDSGRFGLIGQRLQSKNRLLTDYEAELVRLHQIQREVELLSKAAIDNTSPVLVAGLLSEMINTGIVDGVQPYQIKLDSVDPVPSLAAMERAIRSRIIAIEAETGLLQEDVLILQAELAAKQAQLEQLIRDRDVKAETYVVIFRKVQEVQIDASGEGSNTDQVQIASRATVPAIPVGSGRLRNAVVAGVLGLMMGVFGAFALEWWRSGQADLDREQPEAAPPPPVIPEYQD